jgi:hypothetical protein
MTTRKRDLSATARPTRGCSPVSSKYRFEAAIADAFDRLASSAPSAPDPASVLAALLAEHPDATIAALETLLTSDEAVDHTLDEMIRVFVDYGPNFARLNPTDMRLVALRLSRAPCRSLLSKAPKENGDA